MTEQSAPPTVPSLEDRAGMSDRERIRALEVYQVDHDRRIVNLEQGDKDLSSQFNKLNLRLALFTGLIVGVSIALKIIPPDLGKVLEHMF